MRVGLFKPYTAKVVQVPVDSVLRTRLEALEKRVLQQQAAQAQGASATSV